MGKIAEVNRHLNQARKSALVQKKLSTKAAVVKKDKCPLLHKYRDKLKTLQKKGMDGQMVKKPPAESSLYTETNSSAVGNESLPH